LHFSAYKNLRMKIGKGMWRYTLWPKLSSWILNLAGLVLSVELLVLLADWIPWVSLVVWSS